MSIDKTKAMQPVSTVQPRESSEGGSAKARQASDTAAPARAAQVSLSGAQSQLMKPGSQDINSARVEQLKAAIRNGELKMDTGKIADALIQEAKSYLQDK
ncbi:flagellar biosynthesis anti-sigma factor FlgM [Mixta tenebrionis]|uniref:Negative regulator of flagellin synthesis n=1 Tax=Mixta tenebrionis TaxID=2562439 RepID=A0A506VEA5_9GAMM|nr:MULTISPECIES: flagellar biosynthesis anti-sigma factor FlgM [Mixta]QHM75928.1 Negative regulator of flagellin synthesis [Mixta theicola]TPW44454.1 anti-sigma-28 factor FlgM [Mixta tenebrionis]